MQAQLFNQTACLCNKFFKSLGRLFGSGDLNHFNFVELVSSDHTSFLASITSCFLSETRAVSKEFHGEFVFGDNFTCVKVYQSGFGGGEHKAVFLSVLVAVQPINFVAKLGELTCAKTTVVAKLVRGQNKFVTVGDMLVDKEV